MESIARETLIWTIIGVAIAAIGVLLVLPNILEYISNCRKQKRQDRVRDVLLRFGIVTTGEFLSYCPQLSEEQRDLALEELQRDGVIIQEREANTGRQRWRYVVHPQSTSTVRRRG
jgi:competence protein ComGC